MTGIPQKTNLESNHCAHYRAVFLSMYGGEGTWQGTCFVAN